MHLTLHPLWLYFCSKVEQASEFGERPITVDLCENGGSVPVSVLNRRAYVDAYVQHLLVKSVRRQARAFCRGFHKVRRGVAPKALCSAQSFYRLCLQHAMLHMSQRSGLGA